MCDLLCLSLSIVYGRFSSAAALCKCFILFLIVEKYSVPLFIHSSVDRHLGVTPFWVL